jgi:hypothetical protein
MPIHKRKMPAARGPLAKIAISRATEFNYSESDPDEGKLILDIGGVMAREAFNHPDFDKKKFDVFELERDSRPAFKSRRSWTITAHVMRDGIVIRKCFRFNCGAALRRIKEIGQYEKSAKNTGEAKKPLKERGGIL